MIWKILWKIIELINSFALGMFWAGVIISLGLLLFTDEPTMFDFWIDWIGEAAK